MKSWVEMHPIRSTAAVLGGCAAAFAAVITGDVAMNLFLGWLCS